MTNYLWTIFEANVLMTLLFGVFKLTQRYLSFSWQRFSLLSIPALSIGAVWLKHGSVARSSWSYHVPVFELEAIEITAQQEITPGDFSPWSLLELSYWLGVSILFLWLTFNLYKILRVFLRTKGERKEGFTVIEQPNEAPSSFFNLIQLPTGLSEYDHEIIFQHEKIHAQKKHSADRLYFEAIHCLSWFNPLLVFMKKELVQIHEFEVDRIMYNKYRVGYMEFLLAYSLGTSSSFYLLTNQFMTKLTLIKRIKIMKNTSKKVMIAALALPIIAGALTLISFSKEGEKTPSVDSKTNRSKMNPGSQVKPTIDSREVKRNSTSKSVAEQAPEEMKFEKSIEFVAPELTTDETTAPQETEVDKMPEYKGGMEAMTNYMVNNIRYPKVAVDSKTTGKVVVSFVVTKAGKVTKAAVKRGVSKELDAEAIRVISVMPDWIPAEKDGKKVDAEMVLPVSFQL